MNDQKVYVIGGYLIFKVKDNLGYVHPISGKLVTVFYTLSDEIYRI